MGSIREFSVGFSCNRCFPDKVPHITALFRHVHVPTCVCRVKTFRFGDAFRPPESCYLKTFVKRNTGNKKLALAKPIAKERLQFLLKPGFTLRFRLEKIDGAKPWSKTENLYIATPFGWRKVPNESLEVSEEERLSGFAGFAIAQEKILDCARLSNWLKNKNLSYSIPDAPNTFSKWTVTHCYVSFSTNIFLCTCFIKNTFSEEKKSFYCLETKLHPLQ
jgi:hypothetical protein